MLEITPILDSQKEDPVYIQLYRYLKEEIQSENIPPQSKLPSQRKLANHLNLSRNTVNAAYQQLLAEGYIRSEERKGLFVEDIKHELFLHKNVNTINAEIPNNHCSKQEDQTSEIKYDFKYGEIDLKHFPFKLWSQLTMKSIFAEQGKLLLYGDPQGDLDLRKQIARYLYESRGVKCSEHQIIIGAGTQYLLSMLCKIIGKEYTYGIEEPGYNRVRIVLKEYGKAVHPIPLDSYGVNIKELTSSKVRAVFVTPAHQFPLGIVMPISRRLELIEWAKDTDGYIIEDDYDSEFRYEGKPIPALQSLDQYEKVIYMGTFAKSLIPSLDFSYMVLPRHLLAKYHEKYIGYKQTVSRQHQYVLKLFMESEHWSRHLNKVRNVYKKRHNALLASIKATMNNQVRIMGAGAGLHIVIEPRNHMSEQELIDSARKNGVLVYPVSSFYEQFPDKKYPQVLLGFAGLDEKKIQDGIILLSKAWF